MQRTARLAWTCGGSLIGALACDARPPSPTPDPPPAVVEVAPSPAPTPHPQPVDPPLDPWRDIDGRAEWVGFRDDEFLLVARQRGDAGLGEYEVATGALQAAIATPPGSGAPAAWSASAGLLAFSTDTEVILRRWDAAAPDRGLAFASPSALAFSATGDRLAATGCEPGEAPHVTIYATSTGKRITTLRPFGKQKLEYDSGYRLVPAFIGPDRLALLLANDTPSDAVLAVGPAAKASGWQRVGLTAPDSEWGVAPDLGLALAVSPDGATIAAGNYEAALHFHEPASGEPPTPMPLAGGVVTALALAPDGTWLAAAGEDGKLTVLAMPARTPLAEVPAPKQCVALAVSPDGRHLAGACREQVRIWTVTWTTP